MPASMVKTKRDEKRWADAKARAAEEGHAGNWAYVVSIYQQMRKGMSVPAGLLLLPEEYGRKVWGLCKAKAHKYIKRVPTGKTTKSGKPKYRYYYSVAHGGGVDATDHFVEGASFRHGDGHYHITKRDGPHITIRHDETGETQTIGPRELADKLRTEHSGARKAEGDKIRQDWKDAHASGANPKQLAAIQRRASAVGVQLPYEQHIPQHDIRIAKMLDGVLMPPTKNAEIETSQKDGARGKVKSKVAGNWSIAQSASREVTHIPSGLSVSASVPERNREALFAMLAAKFPEWGAEAKFGDTGSIGKDALAKISGPVQDLAKADQAVYDWNKAQEAVKADRAKAAADKVRASVQTKAPGAFVVTPKPLSQQAAFDEAKGAATKDVTRPSLRAVYYDGKGHAYATDGNRVIVVPTTHDKKEVLSTDDGKESTDDFPNVHQAITSFEKHATKTAHIDADVLRSAMKAAVVTARKADKSGQSVQLRDGAWYVRDNNRDMQKIGDAGHTGDLMNEVTLNPKFVLDALRGAKGTVQIRTGTEYHHPIVVERQDGIKQYIMPRDPKRL